ncbi:MAG: hypothetical protein C4321_03675, partial [Chloroflexota bacterium]
MLEPEDRIARAAELLRAAPEEMVPVAEAERVIGVVTTDALMDVLVSANGRDHIQDLPVRAVMRPDVVFLRGSVTVNQAL